ncbi:MAG: lysophospholipid acyltransferase family protein [Anaerolineae bacterium]
MNFPTRTVTAFIKGLTNLLCRVYDAELAKVPQTGPLIIVANHINFLEVPVIYTRLYPRRMEGLAKAEVWNNPILGLLFNLWGGIPLQRGKADLGALRQALEALENDKILAVAPEGTRSHHGRLQRGRPGVVTLALHSEAPLLPMAYHGGEKFWENLLHLRRTDFHVAVGDPFYLDPGQARASHEIRRKMTDEIMYQIAALLPADYRGHYADLNKATENFLRFPTGSNSNLRRA